MRIISSFTLQSSEVFFTEKNNYGKISLIDFCIKKSNITI